MISLKRAINWAHNHQQNNILPLGVQPASQSRSPLDMATTVAGVPVSRSHLNDTAHLNAGLLETRSSATGYLHLCDLRPAGFSAS
jgi:hypothetical protein